MTERERIYIYIYVCRWVGVRRNKGEGPQQRDNAEKGIERCQGERMERWQQGGGMKELS